MSNSEEMRSTEHATVVVDTKGALLLFDPSFKRIFPDLELGLSFLEVVAEELRPLAELTLISALDSGASRNLRAELLVPSGRRGVDLLFNPLHGVDGRRCAITISIQLPVADQRFGDLRSFVQVMERALDRISSVIISTDSNGRILMINSAAEELTGYRSEEVFGAPLADLFSERGEIRESLQEAFQSAIKGGAVNHIAPMRTKAGKEVNQSWRMSSARLGEETVFMAFGHDPSLDTRRMSQEISLDHSLSLLVQASADLADALDPADSIQRQLDDLVESQGMGFGIIYLLVHEEPASFFSGIDEKAGEEAIKSGILSMVEMEGAEGYSLVRLDPWSPRGTIPEEVSVLVYVPLTFEGRVSGFAIFGTNWSRNCIESRLPLLQIFCNQVLASLRHSFLLSSLAERTWEIQSLYEMAQTLSTTLDVERLLEAILERGAILADADDSLIYRSEGRALRLTHQQGRRAEGEELLSHHVAETGQGSLIHDSESGSSIISVPLKVKEEVMGVITLSRHREPFFGENDYKMIELFSAPAAMALKNASLYEDLSQAAGELGAYNDLLTHDMANYNVPIHGYLEMLLKDPKLDMRQRSFLHKALRQSEKISSLVRNVRALAEIQSRTKGDLLPMDLMVSLRNAMEFVSHLPLCREIRMRVENDPESCHVLADENLEHLFINLLMNACEFGEGKPVEIRVGPYSREGSQCWRVDVVDQGVGVPDDWKRRVFDRFWEQDSDRRAESHGLSLSVVRALCRLYGGEVWVEDRVAGDHAQGAVFSLVLPQAEMADKAP